MDFSSDANANFEGLLAVNREICMMQMAEKTSPDAPPNCAVVSLYSFCMDWQHCAGISPLRRRRGGFPIAPSPPSAPPLLGLSAALLFWLHGESPLRRRPKGNENRRSLRSLFGNVWRRYFWGLFTALFFVARGETSPMRSLYITNIIPKACVSGKQSTVLRKRRTFCVI